MVRATDVNLDIICIQMFYLRSWEFSENTRVAAEITERTKEERTKLAAYLYIEIRETRKAATVSVIVVIICFFYNFILKYSVFACWDKASDGLGIPSLLQTLPAFESSFSPLSILFIPHYMLFLPILDAFQVLSNVSASSTEAFWSPKSPEW